VPREEAHPERILAERCGIPTAGTGRGYPSFAVISATFSALPSVVH
jgi:hypothetical protein